MSTNAAIASIDGNGDGHHIWVLTKDNSTTPPQVVDYPYILCEMKGSMLAFDVPVDYSYLSYDILQDDEILQKGIITVDSPVISIVLDPGTYTVTCTSPDGVQYRGDISF